MAARGVRVALKYPCFVSYCHGYGDEMREFVLQLVKKLNDQLDAFFDEPLRIDMQRLEPGHRYNEALARDLCESVCLVAVLTPKYFQRPYCRRELEAMRTLERQRFGSRPPHDRGLIIPVLWRGRRDDIPEPIRGHVQYCDLSAITSARKDIKGSRDFDLKARGIAQYIYDVYVALGGPAGKDDCGSFQLPTVKQAERWSVKLAPQPLPFRKARP